MPERLQQTTILQEADGLHVAGKNRAADWHRSRNEDTMLYVPEARLGIVMDGSSGAMNGQAASQEGALYLADRLGARKSTSTELTSREMKRALRDASLHIEEVTGARTTAVLVKIVDTQHGREAVFGNLGDSRGYHLTDGALTRTTRDHSLLQALRLPQANKDAADERMDHVLTREDLNVLEEIDPEAWEMFHHRNWVVQILGEQESIYPDERHKRLIKDMRLSPRTNTVTLEQGNRLLLTSDGIHDNLTIDQIEAVLRTSKQQNLGAALVTRAFKTSEQWFAIRAEEDDMTALVITAR